MSPFKALITYITTLDFIVLDVASIIKLIFYTYSTIRFYLYNQFLFLSVPLWLQPATKAPRGRPSPCQGAEENGKKQAESGGSG